jgi:hypothetical protein
MSAGTHGISEGLATPHHGDQGLVGAAGVGAASSVVQAYLPLTSGMHGNSEGLAPPRQSVLGVPRLCVQGVVGAAGVRAPCPVVHTALPRTLGKRGKAPDVRPMNIPIASPWGFGAFLSIDDVPMEYLAGAWDEADGKRMGYAIGDCRGQAAGEALALLGCPRAWAEHWQWRQAVLMVKSDSKSTLGALKKERSRSPMINATERELALDPAVRKLPETRRLEAIVRACIENVIDTDIGTTKLTELLGNGAAADDDSPEGQWLGGYFYLPVLSAGLRRRLPAGVEHRWCTVLSGLDSGHC